MNNSSDHLNNLLPSVYRINDAEREGALRALLAVMEHQHNEVKDDIERLYNDWFIETCQEWVVPYIGDLLDVRGIQTYGSETFSLRAYVANTLAYRRRKGTAAVLEQLARDVTGWRARVVEFFQLLATTQYINHIRPENHRTPDLRDSNRLFYIDGPFDTTAHAVDVRNIATAGGKYNIPNIGIFLWRLQSYYIGGITARPHEPRDGRFYFNPLGADLALFNRPRTEVEITHLAEEINVPAPLRRRALYDDLNESNLYFNEDPVFEIWIDGVQVLTENIRICDLSDYEEGGSIDWRRPEELMASPPDTQLVAVDPELGRLSFSRHAVPHTVSVSYAYGFSGDIAGGPYNRQATVHDWLARFQKPEVEDPDFELWQIGVTKDSRLHTTAGSLSPVVGTLAEAVSAWNTFSHGRRNAFGIIAIMDNATYDEDLSGENALITIPASARLAIVSADWPDNNTKDEDGNLNRPGGRLVPQNRRAHLNTDLNVKGTARTDARAGELVVDGLLIEGKINIRAGNISDLRISHCTLNATANGLEQGLIVESSGEGEGSPPESPPVTSGYNSNLSITIEHSIIGIIDLPDSIPSLKLQDSIIGEDRTAGCSIGSPDIGGAFTNTLAVGAEGTDMTMSRCTIFGRVEVRTLSAENSIFTGIMEVTRRQDGCMRFCYVPPESRTPRRYRCQPDYALVILARKSGKKSAAEINDPQVIRTEYARVRPDFTSSRYGEAAFCQLSKSCPVEIRAGADDGAEMGVFNCLKQPQREGNLRGALQEYLRFGLEAGIFYIT